MAVNYTTSDTTVKSSYGHVKAVHVGWKDVTASDTATIDDGGTNKLVVVADSTDGNYSLVLPKGQWIKCRTDIGITLSQAGGGTFYVTTIYD